MTSPVDIRPDHLEMVRDILRAHLPAGFKVWVFGSRASWTTKDSSDLDLAVEGATRLDHKTMSALEVAFEESDLPYTVDVVDIKRIGDAFRQIVESQRVPLPMDGDGTTASEWREVALGDVLTLQRGFDLPEGKRTPGPYPVIASTGPVGTHHSAAVQGPGVVIGRSGSLGGGQFSSSDFWPLNTTLWVKDFRGNDRRFCYYLLKSLDLAHFNAGSGVPTLNRNHIHPLPVQVPSLPTQRAIAHVLGTLDDKIELNRRMNETLEAMAKALFNDWFVDFGPVRAKMVGREPYLPPDVWSLFPDRLVPSELGEVPAGWEVGTLGECYDLTMGQSPPGSTYNDDGNGTPFFQGSTDFGERYPTNHRYCTEPARLAQTEDTLVSVRAPVGAINRAWEQCCIGRGVAALRHKSGSAPYTYYAIWAAQPEIGQYEHTGTVFGAIGGKQFRALKVLEPPDETVAVFHRIGQDLDRRIRSNVEESRSLAVQRDALLPSLVSGEVAVPI